MRLSSRVFAALLAVGSLLMSPLAAPAVADEGDPVVSVMPPTSSVPGASPAIVDGPFEMVVQVTGGVVHDLTLTPRLPFWAASFPLGDPLTVPAGSCPDVCTVSWRIDPASEATPWYPGVFNVDVSAQMDGRSVQTYSNGANYAPVVRPTWLTAVQPAATPNTVGAAPGVFDTGGSVSFGGYAGRAGDEQVQVKVLPAEGDLSATAVL